VIDGGGSSDGGNSGDGSGSDYGGEMMVVVVVG